MTKNRIIAALALLITAGTYLKSFAGDYRNEVNTEWQHSVLAAVDSFPEKGGYYTGRKVTADFPKSAWRGLNEAFQMQPSDMKPHIAAEKAVPSFCSLATYAALLKALTIWDTDYTISRLAWFNLKPYCGVVDIMNPKGYNQDDGEGCWGRANANGPGIAVLVNELKAGFSFTSYRGAKSEKNRESAKEQYMSDDEWRADEVWNYAQQGDFMKIFWNRNETDGSDSGAIIGVNGNKNDDQEHGHSTIFMGYNEKGEVLYWSSNGPGKDPKNMGYGIGCCDKTKIQRVVFTRITKPENFNNAKAIAPNKMNKWLEAIAGKAHGTTKELYKNCGIK